MRAERCDVLVVGAGIVGLAHAITAHEEGLTVVVVDRDHAPVGSSIRNFGHACVTGQTGELHRLALIARERWLGLASRAGFWAEATGGLAVARTDAELAVLVEVAERTAGVRLFDAAQTAWSLGSDRAHTVGGLALDADIRVDPRTAVPALARWLAAQERAEIRWGCTFFGHDGTLAHTSRGSVRADRVVVCANYDIDRVFPELAAQVGIRRCALQMQRWPDPGFPITPAVLTGSSLLRYDTFAETDGAAAVRTELGQSKPALLAYDCNVMLTQRPDGTLMVGDSHRYAATVDPFLSANIDDVIASDVADVLGLASPPAPVERWQGVYAKADAPFVKRCLGHNLEVCAVTTGIGMTIALGLATREADPA